MVPNGYSKKEVVHNPIVKKSIRKDAHEYTVEMRYGIFRYQTAHISLSEAAPGSLPIMTGWCLKFFPPDIKSCVFVTASIPDHKISRWANTLLSHLQKRDFGLKSAAQWLPVASILRRKSGEKSLNKKIRQQLKHSPNAGWPISLKKVTAIHATSLALSRKTSFPSSGSWNSKNSQPPHSGRARPHQTTRFRSCRAADAKHA